ncbi:MAG: hypothetical protein JWN24_4355 [Phycisphaerales bacterium]|nr:hypothetical protein [Phycisphaerales bacterium]
MPRYQDEDDEPEEDLDESEYPDDDEADWNLDPSTTECPYCGKEISEDAQPCPHCHKYVSEEDAPSRRRGWIVVVVVVLVLLTVLGLLISW